MNNIKTRAGVYIWNWMAVDRKFQKKDWALVSLFLKVRPPRWPWTRNRNFILIFFKDYCLLQWKMTTHQMHHVCCRLQRWPDSRSCHRVHAASSNIITCPFCQTECIFSLFFFLIKVRDEDILAWYSTEHSNQVATSLKMIWIYITLGELGNDLGLIFF